MSGEHARARARHRLLRQIGRIGVHHNITLLNANGICLDAHRCVYEAASREDIELPQMPRAADNTLS